MERRPGGQAKIGVGLKKIAITEEMKDLACIEVFEDMKDHAPNGWSI